MKTSTEFHLFDVKKHSVRYNAAKFEDDPLAVSVYISKSSLPRPFPEKIILTLEPTPEVD